MDILNFISWIKGGRQVTTVDPSKTLLPVGLKDGRRDDGYLAGAISVQDFLNLVPTPPSGLEGTSYILVKGEGTAAENGLELQAAYDAAQLATPYGNPLTSTNRFTIIIAPGDYYSANTFNQFVIDANYIDLISLTGKADVYLSGISVSASATYLKGLNTSDAISLGGIQPGFNIVAGGLTQTYDTCVGGDYSFGWGGTLYSTFINCTGGDYSFCATYSSSSSPIGITLQVTPPDLAGILTNCKAGNYSFGVTPNDFNTNISGTLTNCTAGSNSFGVAFVVLYGNITGTLTNCTGVDLCFTTSGVISGTLTNCKAGNTSFGGFVSTTAEFYNCIGFNNCFAGSFMQAFQGYAYNCIAGADSLGNYDNGPGAPGNFISGGRVSYCTKVFGVFPGVSGAGANTVIACQDSAGLKTF